MTSSSSPVRWGYTGPFYGMCRSVNMIMRMLVYLLCSVGVKAGIQMAGVKLMLDRIAGM